MPILISSLFEDVFITTVEPTSTSSVNLRKCQIVWNTIMDASCETVDMKDEEMYAYISIHMYTNT